MNTQNVKLTKASGFSLIELMVVVAIIALLAAVAAPAYNTYISKSKMTEVSSLVGAQMSVWAEDYSLGTAGNEATLSSPDTGSYINNIVFTPTGLVVTMNNTIGTTPYDADFVSVTPYVATYTGTPGLSGTIVWSCSSIGGANLSDIQVNFFTQPQC